MSVCFRLQHMTDDSTSAADNGGVSPTKSEPPTKTLRKMAVGDLPPRKRVKVGFAMLKFRIATSITDFVTHTDFWSNSHRRIESHQERHGHS